MFLGGGGGAGGTNNSKPENAAYENQAIACNIPDSGDGDTISAKCSSGAAGGGIAILRAKSVTGSGVIDVRGAHGYNVGNDAGGGGGAAGAAVLHVIEGGNASVIASGGDGGNAWASRNLATTCGDGIGGAAVSCRHGPGGGGKIPLAPDYMIGRDGDEIVLRNYKGNTFRYPDPQPVETPVSR